MALILVVAVAARLLVVAGTPDYAPGADPADLDRIAISISEGQGYPDSSVAPGPTALRPPLYPTFLALVYRGTGQRYTAARAAGALLGALTVALLGLLALRVWGGRAALAAMALAAVYPPFLVLSGSLLTENLFLPLVLAALLAALHGAEAGDGRLRWALLAGALAGLAVLTRANGALVLVPLVLAVWGVPRVSRRGLAAPVAVVVAAVVVVAPWTVRNAAVFDAFVPVSTQAGFTAAGTYNDFTRAQDEYPGAWRPPTFDSRLGPLFSSGLDEAELESRLSSESVSYALDHPGYVAEVAVRNALRMFHLGGWGYDRAIAGDRNGPELPAAGFVLFYALVVLALAGACLPEARRAPRWLWLTPVLFASVVLIAGFVRYRAPIDLFIVLLAAIALARLAGRLGLDGDHDVVRVGPEAA